MSLRGCLVTACAVALAACRVDFDQQVACLGDLDCAPGASCVEGRCVPRGTDAGGAPDADLPADAGERADAGEVEDLPPVTFTRPARDGRKVAQSTQSAFPVGGGCEREGAVVVLSGEAAATVYCAPDRTWSTTLDFSAAADGVKTITAVQSVSGRRSAPAQRIVVMDTDYCEAPGPLTATPFAGGAGTNDDPWRICTPGQLQAVDGRDDGSFLLQNELDLAGLVWQTTSGFTAAGRFDGNGFAIRSLSVPDGGNYTALFGGGNGIIEDVILEDGSVTGLGWTGLLTSELLESGTLRRCRVSGRVRTNGTGWISDFGGVVGDMRHGSRVEDVIVDIDIASISNAAGLVGFVYGGDLEHVLVRGTVLAGDSNASAGGLTKEIGDRVGAIRHVRIEADVTGGDVVGGLTQMIGEDNVVSDSVVTGSVTRTSATGDTAGVGSPFAPASGTTVSFDRVGFAGSASAPDSASGITAGGQGSIVVRDSYSSGTVSAQVAGGVLDEGTSLDLLDRVLANGQSSGSTSGPLVAERTAHTAQCFWDRDATGAGSNAPAVGALSLSTAEAKSADAYPMWDFGLDRIWTSDPASGYPVPRSHLPASEGLSITHPAADGAKVSLWSQRRFRLRGRCDPDGSPVTLSGSASAVGFCDELGLWEARPDLSALPDGPLSFTAAQTTAAGQALTAQRSLQKDARYCESRLVNAPFAGGDGLTESTPFTICTPAQLDAIRSSSAQHFQLRNDLDLAASALTPIPLPAGATFDGASFTLSRLRMELPTNTEVGLFVGAGNNTWRDLTLEQVLVVGNLVAGGLASSPGPGATIERVSLTGSRIVAADTAGGLFGYGAADVLDSSVDATVVTTGGQAGGIAGLAQGGRCIGCATRGKIVGPNEAGGLYGRAGSTSVTRSRCDAHVNATWSAGGLIGLSEGSLTITDSLATGIVHAGTDVGGLVGAITGVAGDTIFLVGCSSRATVRASSTTDPNAGGLVGSVTGSPTSCILRDSRSSATVVASDVVGGLVGRGNPALSIVRGLSTGVVIAGAAASFVGGIVGEPGGAACTNVHWNTDTSRRTADGCPGAQAQSDAAFRLESTFVGFDFTNGPTWVIEPGRWSPYPVLYWEGGP